MIKILKLLSSFFINGLCCYILFIMPVPILSDVAATTIAGIFLASMDLQNLKKIVTKKVRRWVLSCPYQPHSSVTRRQRTQYTVTESNPVFRRKFELKWMSLKKMVHKVIEKVQIIPDCVQFIRYPYSDLDIDAEEQSALNSLLECCDYFRPIPFWVAIPFWKQVYMKKRAEGSYGEIYDTVDTAKENRVFKFVPIHGNNPDPKLSNVHFGQIVADVICSRELPKLRINDKFQAPNFPLCYGLNLVKGKFPELLTKAWLNYDMRTEKVDEEGNCGNPRPDLYPVNQFFSVIELEDCGKPLSESRIYNSMSCLSCACQVSAALAVAEGLYEFEHRDLHLGNILARETNKVSLEYILNGEAFTIDTCGLELFIIDFTMSRIKINDNIFNMNLDMKTSNSNPNDEFDWTDHTSIYELQSLLCKTDWSSFNPLTNIFWLKYLLANLLDWLGDRINDNSSENECGIFELLGNWKKELINYSSVTNFLQTEILHKCPIVCLR